MTFDHIGSLTFTTGGEPRVFNYSVAVADEKLRVEIEDSVTFEKWRTADLAIHDFANEHTTIPQAAASVYAKLVVQCLEQHATDPSMHTSLSKPSDSDKSRLLCVSCQFQLFTQAVTLEYAFQLSPQPVDHVERLARENDRLKAHNEQLTLEIEQLKDSSRETSEEVVVEREQHIAQVARLTQEIEQLKTEVRKSREQMVSVRNAEVVALTREVDQLKTDARKSREQMVSAHNAEVSALTREIEKMRTEKVNVQREQQIAFVSMVADGLKKCDILREYNSFASTLTDELGQLLVHSKELGQLLQHATFPLKIELRKSSGKWAYTGKTVTVKATGYGKHGDLRAQFHSEVTSFQVGTGQRIKVLDEVVHMQVGEKALSLCPPEFAYGESGYPSWGIAPNAAVKYEIELLKME